MEIYGFNSAASMATAMDKQTFGAQVVSKTLDYMNYGPGNSGGGYNTDYDFQKSVLGSHYSGLGAIADIKV